MDSQQKEALDNAVGIFTVASFVLFVFMFLFAYAESAIEFFLLGVCGADPIFLYIGIVHGLVTWMCGKYSFQNEAI